MVLCTVAIVVVALAVHFRVRRLRQKQMEAQVGAAVENAAESSAEHNQSDR